MKQAEYLGEVLEDGHLSLPEDIRERLGLHPSSYVQVTVAVPETDQKEREKAWACFRQMGKNAVSGRLSNTAVDHDKYLYNKKSS